MSASGWAMVVSGGSQVSATAGVVEPDHRDVLGHPPAGRRAARAGRRRPSGPTPRTPRPGRARRREQLLHRPLPAGLGEVALGDQLGVAPRGRRRRAPSRYPAYRSTPGDHVQRPGDGGDPAPPACRAGARSRPRRRRGCRRRRRRPRRRRAAGRTAPAAPRPRRGCRAAGRRCAATSGSRRRRGPAAAYRPTFSCSRSPRAASSTRFRSVSASVADTPRTMLAKNGSEKTWVFGLRQHQRDRVGAPGHQAAGHAVGDVAQLRDGRLHRLARLRAHPRGVVDDPRDGRPGDAGQHGHLVERRRRRSLVVAGHASPVPLRRASGCMVPGEMRFTIALWTLPTTLLDSHCGADHSVRHAP